MDVWEPCTQTAHKKTEWDNKPDKLSHHKKMSFKNRVRELDDEDDENDINYYK